MNSRLRRIGVIAGTTLALVTPFATGALATVIKPDTPRQGQLVQVGPIADNGFPTWYKDSNGIRLEACLTMEDPLCPVLADTVPDPTQPISFPDNFPDEFFYQLAGTTVTATGVGDVRLVMDLEGAFASEVQDGDQMVFGRIRIRAKDLPDGQTIRVTHPYGIDVVTGADGDGVFMTEDVGIAPGEFGGALKSRIGPFLQWDPAIAPAAPEGYTGDPGTPHQVIGSPYGTNFVKIELQDPAAPGGWTEVGGTDLFEVQGRKAVNVGVDVDRATYTFDSTGQGVLEVWATSEPGESIQVTGDPALGFPTTSMRGQDGRYYARLPLTGNLPDDATVEVVNASDNPVAKKSTAIADSVTVNQAAYDADAETLTVHASSSDAEADGSLPQLTVEGFGPLSDGAATFHDVVAPPPSITVTSSEHGMSTMQVNSSGGTFGADAPVAAFVAPSGVQVGQNVTLDAGASLGEIDSYAWRVAASPDPALTLTGADTSKASFTPTSEGTYSIGLTVTGPGGTSSELVQDIVVGATTAADAVVGPDQTVVRGTKVTLDGSGSVGATGFTWTQTSGAPVTLSDAAAASPTFTFPAMALPTVTTTAGNPGYVYNNDPLVFSLTVSGAGGSTDTAQVTITPQAETISGVTARYRTRGEWRVDGTSSILAGQRVAIVLGNQPTGRVIGTTTVQPDGTFGFRDRGSIAGPGTVRTITIVTATGGLQTAALTVTS